MTSSPTTADLRGHPAAGGTWLLDPRSTTIALRTRSMWGLLPVTGTFRAAGGHVHVTPAWGVTGRVEVDAGSIDTGLRIRDGHLRGADFLAVVGHPLITVDLQRVEATAGSWTAVGVLRVRGQALPLRFPISVTSSGPDEVHVAAELQVDRSQVGIGMRSNGATVMDNRLVVHAVFHRG